MAYATVRIYEGTSDRTPEEISSIAEQELLPQLGKTEGGAILRYTTIKFADGRLGSFSAYHDKDAAERGAKLAAEWLDDTGFMTDYKLVQTLQGEVCYTLNDPDGEKSLKGASGVGRIYDTDASSNAVRAALEPLADHIKGITGFLRLNVIKLDDGRGVAAFSAFETEEGVQRWTETVRSIRAETGSTLSQMLPTDPETLELTIIDSFTP